MPGPTMTTGLLTSWGSRKLDLQLGLIRGWEDAVRFSGRVGCCESSNLRRGYCWSGAGRMLYASQGMWAAMRAGR